MSEKRYFGTDGIRGKVGEYPITPDFMLKLGWAVGRVLADDGNAKVLIGKDTRISGYMFESALEAGLSAAGVDISLLGPMPTPGIAYLTRTFRANAGIVISASHNPYNDNGIKFFSPEGAKLSDEIELAIEAALDQPMHTVASSELGKAERIEDAAGRYIEFCKRTIPNAVNLKSIKLVIDCAHGATYHVAPSVFEELGADVIKVGTNPDGLNINAEVGSTNPKALQQAVKDHKADLGIALDGDGDRIIMVDHKGELVDGDEILFIIARRRHEKNALLGPVVGTLMSNLGLQHALQAAGIDFQRAKVGDRYVLEMLKKHHGVIGGETSGHIICLDRTSTGDGIIAALQVLEALVHKDSTLRELKSGMTKFPQHMINVPLVKPVDVMNQAVVKDAVSSAEAELGNDGRVLLRPSGTEPLIRVMVEGKDDAQVGRLANQLAATVTESLDLA